MKAVILVAALFATHSALAMGEQKSENITQPKVSESTKLAEASKDTPKLASDRIKKPYNTKLEKSLLRKLKKNLPLTEAEQAHFEIVYEKGYVGEEEMTSADQKIFSYTRKVMDDKTRKAIEKRTQQYAMVGPDQPENASKAP